MASASREELNHVCVEGEAFWAEGTSRSWAAGGLECSRRSEEASVAAAE